MKKRFLIIATALALVSILAMPAITSADTTTGTTTVNGNIAPGVASINPTIGVQGTTYSNVIITGSDFTGASSVSLGAGITVNSYTVNSSSQITANITVASGATAGSRDVSVTVSGVTGTKTAAFTVAAITFSITAPSAISLGNMVKGQTATGQSSTAGSVTTNASNWLVTAKDSNTTHNPGHMYRSTDNTPLLTQLRIGKTAGPSTNAGDSTGLVYTPSDGTTLPFYVAQDVNSNDVVGAYSITIVFTGSIP